MDWWKREVIIAVNFPINATGNRKPEKNSGFNGIRARDPRVTGAMLYQLTYEATHWEQGQLWVPIFPWKEWNDIKYMKWFIFELRM